MKLQLIMLPNPIVVSSERIKINQQYLTSDYRVVNWHEDFEDDVIKNPIHWKNIIPKPIIAGIPSLPTIDFSALSDEDVKKIGWVDVEKLATKYATNPGMMSYVFPDKKEGFVEGFKTAQSLNDKKYSEEDMRNAFNAGDRFGRCDYTGRPDLAEDEDEYIQQLSQPKVFNIEASLENNSIKITKIL